jgi:DNA-binding transcriptional MocR family regulator
MRHFHADADARRQLRLSVSLLEEDQVADGVRRLAELVAGQAV